MTETVVQNSATAILTSIFYQALADSIIWLVVAAVVIVCDLFFGCEAARKRGERVRISRAVRRTVNKMCEYLCWVMLGITISIGFAADWLKYLIFAIIYGNELSSCLSNYFAAKGKRITFNVFSLLGKNQVIFFYSNPIASCICSDALSVRLCSVGSLASAQG